MESIISKINNFIGNNIYDSDSDDESHIHDSDNNLSGFFKKDLYENFNKKFKKNFRTKADRKAQNRNKREKRLRVEKERNKIPDSINDPQEVGKYNKSKLIRFTKKNPETKTPLDVNNPTSLSHKFAITEYGAAILNSVTKKYYKKNVPPNIKAFDYVSINVGSEELEGKEPGFLDYYLAKRALDRSQEIKSEDLQPNKYIETTLNKDFSTLKHRELNHYLLEGGSYQLDSKPVDGDNDGYKWIEARSSDNPPRLRYYKIILFAADKEDPELDPNNTENNSYLNGGYFWYHNAPVSQLAFDFNYHGLHVSPSRTTDSKFWNTAGRVAAETWFPPIVMQSPSEAASGGGFNMTKFLNDYAIQQASYPDKEIDEGVDTPDLFSNKLEWSLISPDDIDAAMIAADDAEFDAELAAQALDAKQKEMLNALGQAVPSDPLLKLKSLFLYDNLLTIHLRKEPQKGVGNKGKVINKYTSDITSKPSFYKTITKVTPDHSKIMTNFIEDVKDRTIYICSNVLLGISFCFLPYIKFPVLDALVHTLAYRSSSNQQNFNISRMPLTAKFTALFLSLQTSLITSLKTNAAPLCAIIGLSIITMTLPTIHYKPGKIDIDGLRQSWEGLATLNYFYMLIALFPPMAPNIVLEEALYSMFFPPGGEFDKVLEKVPPLIFMMILQSTFATDFLVLNIWFVCMVPAVCLLLFPLFRTLARYVGGDMGNQAAGMIDKITDQLIEPSVNDKDSDTGLSMMGLVTKVILVLAVFFIFAEFFDAVNDHFGLSNLITQMVNTFRNICTIIPEILLVFFIVMTFSKAIKSVGAFNEQASATAKWDNETKQKLEGGKNPAYAMLEYFFGALKDATLLSLGTITGKQDAYQAEKEKQLKEAKAEFERETEAVRIATENQTEDNKIMAQKEIALANARAKLEMAKNEKLRVDNISKDARRREAFNARRDKTRQNYELKRLQLAAKNDKEIGERQIEMAMLLGSGQKLGVSPLQIKQMMTSDSAFKTQMENAIKSGQDITTVVQKKLGNMMMSMPKGPDVKPADEQKEPEAKEDNKSDDNKQPVVEPAGDKEADTEVNDLSDNPLADSLNLNKK